MADLARQLFEFDPEKTWSPEELGDRDDALTHFKRYLKETLKILANATAADHAYVGMSGLQIGHFMPFVAYRRAESSIQAMPTHGRQILISKYLWTENPVEVIDDPTSDPLYAGLPTVSQKLLMKLRGHGDTFGFISLDREHPHRFSSEAIGWLTSITEQLSWRIAEQNFSMRVRKLAESFASGHQDNPKILYDEILERANLAFAADGGILRMYDSEFDELHVESYKGAPSKELLEERPPGEGLCGRIYADGPHGWAMAMNVGEAEYRSGGAAIHQDDIDRMRRGGITACLLMRLESESAGEHPSLGTLSCYYQRPIHFSYRDVALFQSFCQRAADAIALHRQTALLIESYDNLRMQGQRLTHVEIVSLLAHDLFHKSFHACANLRTYIDKCRKTLNDRSRTRSHERLEPDASNAMEAAEKVQQSLEQLRAFQNLNTEQFEETSTFTIQDLVNEIKQTLKGALDRTKLSIEAKYSGNLQLVAPRKVLEQVLYNLIINSIDAAKSRRSTRPMAIHLNAHEETPGGHRRIIIQFSDEGPGIDRSEFKHAREVFEIGRTTRKFGTGTGLPVARTLLGRYFGGNLTLEDMENARFKIVIPA